MIDVDKLFGPGLPRLQELSAGLNSESQVLTNTIEMIEEKLKQLNLGVPVEIQIGDEAYGYSRIGHHGWMLWYKSVGMTDGMRLRDAPRPKRIAGLRLLPALIAKLNSEATKLLTEITSANVKLEQLSERSSSVLDGDDDE
jgi:hypothetical protein